MLTYLMTLYRANRKNLNCFKPHSEDGQGLVEYALILALIAVVVIVVLALLGPWIAGYFATIGCVMTYPTAIDANCRPTPAAPVP